MTMGGFMDCDYYAPLSPEDIEHIRAERIAKDPLAIAINELVKAIQVDFVEAFNLAFKGGSEKVEALRLFKRRLYQKLRGKKPADIVDGYELCFDRMKDVDTKRRKLPDIPSIVADTDAAEKLRKQREREKEEAERRSRAIEAPKIECNPLEMLATAHEAAKHGNGSTTTREERLRNHEAILTLHSRSIRHYQDDGSHKCAVGNCHKLGSITDSTRGGSNWYCLEHAKMNGV
jgi:hypothetical protein